VFIIRILKIVLGSLALMALLVGHAQASEPSVVINEVMWMGSAASNADEWIELRNLSDQPVDVSGWVLTKKSSGVETPMLTIPAGKVIPSRGYFIIANYAETNASSHLTSPPDVVDAAVSLVNSDLQLKLYDATNALVDTADDGVGVPQGGSYQSGVMWKSMERDVVPGDGTLKESWHTASASVGFDDGAAELGTPGAVNSNLAPTITLTMPTESALSSAVPFDATETTDPEGDALTFAWEFGDGITDTGPTPSHQYSRAGDFTVRLTVSDGQVGVLEQRRITILAVVAPPNPPDPTPAPVSVTPKTPAAKTPSAPKSSAPPKSSEPEPRDNTGKVLLSALLPNPAGTEADGEIIELLNADKRSVDLHGWSVTDGSTTYTFDETTTLAVGQRLTLDRATTKIALNNGGETVLLKRPDGSTANGVKFGAAPEGATFSRQGTSVHWKWDGGQSADAVANTDDRDVREGVVTSLPGMFAKNWFTLETGDGAVQVYATTATFPAVKLGDHLRVTGVVSLVTAGPRLRIAATKDVRVIGSGAADPRRVSASDLGEGDLFGFVEVSGEVSSGTGRNFTVNDGTGDVAISLPLSVKKPKITASVTGTIRGIVVRSKDGVVIRPRSVDDLQLTLPDTAPPATTGAVLGVSAASAKTSAQNPQTQTIVASNDQRRTLMTLLPLGGAALLLSAWLWYRKRHALDANSDE